MRVAIAVLALVAACGGDGADPPYAFTDVAPCPALGPACDPVPGTAPALTDPVVVAPSAALPPEAVSQLAHNNLDVAWFRGRLYFAYRTGPNHFAHEDVVLHVVSTADQVTWVHEQSMVLHADIREPRFLVAGDRLFLYTALLGTILASFDPQYTQVSELVGPGEWTAPERVLDDTFIAWRTRTLGGVPSLFGYVGGENIYEADGEPVRVSWLTTTDGRSFAPAVAGQAVVLEGGSSETDAALLDDGALVAISRNELGDELGWGSKICRAEAGALGAWQCVGDPKKYDSPLVFRHGPDVYLIARRQVTESGVYDLMMRGQPPADQTRAYQIAYWQTPKRCALWRVDPIALAVTHVLDLPSAGDTCFPGLVELGGGRYLVYNYTSPLDTDPTWLDGQFGPTLIYWVVLTLP